MRNNIKKIRQNVFETNSSSTHSICIAKNTELTLPKEIRFTFGEFGWEHDHLYSISEKASYLITGFYQIERQDDFDKIINKLENRGIKVYIENYDETGYNYVDHGDELAPFLNDLLESEDKLFNFLFSNLSFIITGNDNSDHNTEIEVDYEYDEYYKGN